MSEVFSSPTQLKPFLSRQCALIGLDVGTKTIGIAVSDQTRTIATPRQTIKRTKFSQDANLLLKLILEENVAAIVVGLPLNMNATQGPKVQSIRTFAHNLARISKLPIALWDERLSTVAVERVLIDANCSRQRRGQLIDKLAARWILQGALDLMVNA